MSRDRLELEDLIRKAERSTFGEIEQRITDRLSSMIETAGIKRDYLHLPAPAFTDQDIFILALAYHDSIQLYKNAAERKLGGPYFLHPDDVFRIMLEAGYDDITTLIVGLDHDVFEEMIATDVSRECRRREERDRTLRQIRFGESVYESDDEREEAIKEEKRRIKRNVKFRFTGKKKKGQKLTEEQRRIKRYKGEYERHKYGILNTNGKLEHGKAYAIASGARRSIDLMTRSMVEKYYRTMGRLFYPHSNKRVNEEDIRKAIAAKFADREANMNDLEIPDVARRMGNITYSSIVNAWEQGLVSGTKTNLQESIEIMLRIKAQQHPERKSREFTGSQRLYQIYKSLILLSVAAATRLNGRAHLIPGILFQQLAQTTYHESETIINHLSTYHCGIGSTLSPDGIYEISARHAEYETMGGYDKVTRAGDHPFNGVLATFFDTRVRGDNEALDSMMNNRHRMMIAAVALRHLASKYLTDSTYCLQGLDHRGLKPAAPVR